MSSACLFALGRFRFVKRICVQLCTWAMSEALIPVASVVPFSVSMIAAILRSAGGSERPPDSISPSSSVISSRACAAVMCGPSSLSWPAVNRPQRVGAGLRADAAAAHEGWGRFLSPWERSTVCHNATREYDAGLQRRDSLALPEAACHLVLPSVFPDKDQHIRGKEENGEKDEGDGRDHRRCQCLGTLPLGRTGATTRGGAASSSRAPRRELRCVEKCSRLAPRIGHIRLRTP